jgi:hypothetical protein
MSFHERKSKVSINPTIPPFSVSNMMKKKRKTGHNGNQDTTSFKPSAQFTPVEGGRDWTVSVAIPTSILTRYGPPILAHAQCNHAKSFSQVWLHKSNA